MKKLLSIVLVLALTLGCVCFAGCDPEEAPALAVCLASEPDTIDPALNSAVDGATLIIHAFSGLVGWQQDSTGKLVLYADCAEALPTPTIETDGSATYVFTLKEGLKWSDGSELKASEFEFAWKRAASAALGADYGYMFDVIKGYGEDDVNDMAPLAVTADDNARTITVVLNSAVPYFMELCAFPTYMPVKASLVSDEAWATKPDTYIGNGPYKMTSWEHDSKIVYEKNENYHDADSITMDKIEFHLTADDGAMLANFKSGSWKFIDGVPNDEISNLKVDYPEEFFITGQLGTYYACFNINENLLPAGNTLEGVAKEAAQEEIRFALSLLLDRNYIVEEIGQAGQLPASSFVAMGLSEPDGSEFYKNAGHSDDYIGYYDVSKEAFEGNTTEAVSILKKYYDFDEQTNKFTNFPAIDYLFNESTGHQQIGEYIQAAYEAYGISIELKQQEWNTFLNTRKNGQYVMARNGWLADYNDPISFLDMWLSGSGNNDVQFGKDGNATLNHYSIDATSLGYSLKVENGTWAETYDECIKLIKSEGDQVKRFALMHLAEDLLMQTNCLVPIYYYTDIFMCSESLEGVFSSPLGYKYFMYATFEA